MLVTFTIIPYLHVTIINKSITEKISFYTFFAKDSARVQNLYFVFKLLDDPYSPDPRPRDIRREFLLCCKTRGDYTFFWLLRKFDIDHIEIVYWQHWHWLSRWLLSPECLPTQRSWKRPASVWSDHLFSHNFQNSGHLVVERFPKKNLAIDVSMKYISKCMKYISKYMSKCMIYILKYMKYIWK